MNTNEETTGKLGKSEGLLSARGNIEEIQRVALPVLSKMYETDDEAPESSLLQQAQRLNNVAHSYIEEREKNYLSDNMGDQTRIPILDDIKAVCLLTSEARQNIKLAMDIKKDRAKALTELLKVMKP